jgi:hypothetical protein
VDDELDICLVLKIVLEKTGFLVDYFYNPVRQLMNSNLTFMI